MFRIGNLAIIVMLFAVVQSQTTSYELRSHKGTPVTIDCDSRYASRLLSAGKLFQCGDSDGSCLDRQYVCDSVIDCPNYADETNAIACATKWSEYCALITKEDNGKPFNGDSCSNNMCITECDVCDGTYADCADESDEANCDGQSGPDSERCADYNRRK